MNRKITPASASLSVREVWESAYNEIVQPDHFTVCTLYYITHWLPKLGGNGHLIVTVLRSLGYFNRKTGTTRDGIDIEQKDLAKLCGLGVRTLQREFLENQTLARFVQREFETLRDRTGRITREHYIYRIKMDDPLIEEDQARFEAMTPGMETPIRQNVASEQEPIRQNDAPVRQNDVSTRQNDAPIRQNDVSTRQNGVCLNGSITLTTLTTLITPTTAALPGVSLFALEEEIPEKPPDKNTGQTTDLFGRVGDPLADLIPDEYTALELKAREKVIRELGPPICDLARQGKAMRDVKAMMRVLLAEQGSLG